MTFKEYINKKEIQKQKSFSVVVYKSNMYKHYFDEENNEVIELMIHNRIYKHLKLGSMLFTPKGFNTIFRVEL